ncbi:hypothetical protein BSKO_02807 [Bryopsis sp. KO-2023]|nr:hypothetical protein BSKO_02807 [Bryopsis sp. KO-2023]
MTFPGFLVQGVEQGSDVAIAFALVVGAGLCTTLGASFAFCARIANKKVLAISLGLSAGVMIYVSFGEIFMVKALDEFRKYYCPEQNENPEKDCSEADDKALRYATLCFFAGIVVTHVLDLFVHQIVDNPFCLCGKSKVIRDSQQQTHPHDGYTTKDKDELELGNSPTVECAWLNPFPGLMSGIAIALHNFPEGLATFVATVADPKAGVAIAVAVALHNLPEGLVVAMPLYYSTGSRLKGVMWAFLSGVSEPIGGLFGWVVLANMGEVAYAVLFAIVAGMMVYIAVSELIPTALRFDPVDKYVTKSCFVGMAVMAASLLMFTA